MTNEELWDFMRNNPKEYEEMVDDYRKNPEKRNEDVSRGRCNCPVCRIWGSDIDF